ncbi:MAG: polysaccharide biosynthesis protein [Sedimentisphaerales bacterium]|nr:polysaccharide biosynthesis protein [Sedimentisphaerales bacterium]
MPDSNAETQLNDKNQDLSQSSLLLRYRKLLIIFAHILAFAASLMLSFLVANNMQFRRVWLIDQYPPLLFFFVIIKLVIFGFFNQYRGWWRYVGITDLIGILRASLVSTLIIVSLWSALIFAPTSIRLKLQDITSIGQGIFMADLFTTFLLLAGLRMLIRLYHEEFRTIESGRLKRLLIVGSGNTGVTLLGDLHKKQVAEYEVIGFIDDDPSKQGTFILGLPVLGTVEDLPKICKERDIDEIAIAMPSATHRQRRRVIQMCEGIKIRFNTVPSFSDIASGKLRVSQIRNVGINDLLGREAVELDLRSIEAFLKNKVIFVSGAGGSIGSEMCRQVCNFGPKLLLLVEQAENPLFYIERELRSRFPALQIKAIICDITDKIRVDEIFDKFRPEVVIHAAAHKHVPLMELNPSEAVKNNVVGTQNVADAADRFGSTNFVMISTDKAVNPTSIMGSSKRIAEMYIQDLARTSKTQFVTVRFGNVLDSEGSVVPIFKKQIAEGGPVTVTHPEMKRYFMTIPEASQLVLQAATMGKGGEIFVLDMGEPVKIVDLAKELITLSGFSPDEDIEIKFTGIRPGEKLFEELSIAGEDMQLTSHPKIAIWKNIIKDREKLRAGINELVTTAKTGSYDEITKKIKELVPTYIGSTNDPR